MNSLRIKALLAAVLLATPPLTLAGQLPLSYEVNRTIGPGSVIGTIETDGKIGVLAGTNILGWSLTIDAGDVDGPLTLLGPGNSLLLLTGSLLSATVNNLLFDFTGGTALALFQTSPLGAGVNWWCLEGINANCAGTGSSTESVARSSGKSVFVTHAGQVAIATLADANVPEPASVVLFGIALAGLAATRRKQRV